MEKEEKGESWQRISGRGLEKRDWKQYNDAMGGTLTYG